MFTEHNIINDHFEKSRIEEILDSSMDSRREDSTLHNGS